MVALSVPLAYVSVCSHLASTNIQNSVSIRVGTIATALGVIASIGFLFANLPLIASCVAITTPISAVSVYIALRTHLLLGSNGLDDKSVPINVAATGVVVSLGLLVSNLTLIALGVSLATAVFFIVGSIIEFEDSRYRDSINSARDAFWNSFKHELRSIRASMQDHALLLRQAFIAVVKGSNRELFTAAVRNFRSDMISVRDGVKERLFRLNDDSGYFSSPDFKRDLEKTFKDHWGDGLTNSYLAKLRAQWITALAMNAFRANWTLEINKIVIRGKLEDRCNLNHALKAFVVKVHAVTRAARERLFRLNDDFKCMSSPDFKSKLNDLITFESFHYISKAYQQTIRRYSLSLVWNRNLDAVRDAVEHTCNRNYANIDPVMIAEWQDSNSTLSSGRNDHRAVQDAIDTLHTYDDEMGPLSAIFRVIEAEWFIGWRALYCRPIGGFQLTAPDNLSAIVHDQVACLRSWMISRCSLNRPTLIRDAWLDQEE